MVFINGKTRITKWTLKGFPRVFRFDPVIDPPCHPYSSKNLLSSFIELIWAWLTSLENISVEMVLFIVFNSFKLKNELFLSWFSSQFWVFDGNHHVSNSAQSFQVNRAHTSLYNTWFNVLTFIWILYQSHIFNLWFGRVTSLQIKTQHHINFLQQFSFLLQLGIFLILI